MGTVFGAIGTVFVPQPTRLSICGGEGGRVWIVGGGCREIDGGVGEKAVVEEGPFEDGVDQEIECVPGV